MELCRINSVELEEKMNIQILYPGERHFKSFHEALSFVARERTYIEMIEPPPFEDVALFQRALLAKNGPVYYAIKEDRVIGWCDVFPEENPRLCHRGGLGMGILPEFRGQSIGSKLLSATLAHAKTLGLEKVELNVYTSNLAAISLYRKFGFEQEGLLRKYRKLDEVYFDCLTMAKFL